MPQSSQFGRAAEGPRRWPPPSAVIWEVLTRIRVRYWGLAPQERPAREFIEMDHRLVNRDEHRLLFEASFLPLPPRALDWIQQPHEQDRPRKPRSHQG